MIVIPKACFALLVIGATLSAASAPRFRVERRPISGGADLVTWFEALPDDHELPLLSVLDDSEQTGLRQVWVYTVTPPSVPRRLASAVPFFYHRLWNPPSSYDRRRSPSWISRGRIAASGYMPQPGLSSLR